MSKTPLDSAMDRIDWRCAHCGAKAGTCDCSTRCECGWFVRKGEQCRNEIHRCPIVLDGIRCYLEVGHAGECDT